MAFTWIRKIALWHFPWKFSLWTLPPTASLVLKDQPQRFFWLSAEKDLKNQMFVEDRSPAEMFLIF